MSTALIIYIIGYIACYYCARYIKKDKFGWTWGEFIQTLFVSLFSWLGVFLLLIHIIQNHELFDKEPPKWL